MSEPQSGQHYSTGGVYFIKNGTVRQFYQSRSY